MKGILTIYALVLVEYPWFNFGCCQDSFWPRPEGGIGSFTEYALRSLVLKQTIFLGASILLGPK